MEPVESIPEVTPAQRQANRRVGWRLAVVTAGMFAFGFALVPLYSVFCAFTGINGKTGRIDANAVDDTRIDQTRVITVQLVANINDDLPWEVAPLRQNVYVHPGEQREIHYLATNHSDHAIVARAVASVAPGTAGKYFNKTRCFCFTDQTLQHGERRDLAAVFVIDPALPSDVQTISLAYTFFARPADSAGVRDAYATQGYGQ